MNVTGPAPSAAPVDGVDTVYRHDPYGKWHQVNDKPYEDDMPDLQLPDDGRGGFVEVELFPELEKDKKPKLEFEQKTVETFGKSSFTKGDSAFKKRKPFETAKRNVRSRTDDK